MLLLLQVLFALNRTLNERFYSKILCAKPKLFKWLLLQYKYGIFPAGNHIFSYSFSRT